jgi:phage tail sheath protein FI
MSAVRGGTGPSFDLDNYVNDYADFLGVANQQDFTAIGNFNNQGSLVWNEVDNDKSINV